MEDACELLLEEEGLTVKDTDMTVVTPGSDDLKELLKELKGTVELQQKQLQNQIVAASNEKKWYQFWK